VAGSTHDALVAWIARTRGADTSGFRRRLSELFADIDPSEIGEWPSLRPDAFVVDEEAQRITCFEVTITHPPTDETLDTYQWLWSQLEYLYWKLELQLVDRTGALRPVDLAALYYGTLMAQTAAGPPY
jgi:hypothetical protein